jgi:branched-chain amino acid transport system substrate-binding protein
MLSRRALVIHLPVAALVAGWAGRAPAAGNSIAVGITLPLTGADADDANLIKDGAMLALDEANAKGGVAGYQIEVVVLDNGTATAGQYDPAQAATNARKLASDSRVVANIGPQMSGDGKAMSAILSQADLATITPASTNPDITNPQFAGQYRPAGKAVYFRTVTTDAYQGPNMANYFARTLKVKRIYIVDDGGAYGVGMANAFAAQGKTVGMDVLGHDQLDPREADYTTILTKIKGLKPDGLYYGGVAQAGVKLVKQSYDILPKIIKGGGDGMYSSSVLNGAGFPSVAGWYATIAAPYVFNQSKVQEWSQRFQAKYGRSPEGYSVTAYDAALVVLDAVKRVAASGKPVTRGAVRDAIQSSHLETLQGKVSFDNNGDIQNRIVSVFQVLPKQDAKYPVGDVLHQFKYLGVAPQTA